MERQQNKGIKCLLKFLPEKLKRKIKGQPPLVSPNNHLVNSFIYGFDDREERTRNNPLVNARFLNPGGPERPRTSDLSDVNRTL